MGNQAVGAVLDSFFRVTEVSSAVRSQHVEGAVAEQTAETSRIRDPVAGEIFTFRILEKGIVLSLPEGFSPVFAHLSTPSLSFSVSFFEAVFRFLPLPISQLFSSITALFGNHSVLPVVLSFQYHCVLPVFCFTGITAFFQSYLLFFRYHGPLPGQAENLSFSGFSGSYDLLQCLRQHPVFFRAQDGSAVISLLKSRIVVAAADQDASLQKRLIQFF